MLGFQQQALFLKIFDALLQVTLDLIDVLAPFHAGHIVGGGA